MEITHNPPDLHVHFFSTFSCLIKTALFARLRENTDVPSFYTFAIHIHSLCSLCLISSLYPCMYVLIHEDEIKSVEPIEDETYTLVCTQKYTGVVFVFFSSKNILFNCYRIKKHSGFRVSTATDHM